MSTGASSPEIDDVGFDPTQQSDWDDAYLRYEALRRTTALRKIRTEIATLAMIRNPSLAVGGVVGAALARLLLMTPAQARSTPRGVWPCPPSPTAP